ncbi:MAG: hypothetical protein SFZ23_10115 [Planctomycetota bacterium]|nr:hypothetical protein [Planctomycetota bacterium]
MERVNTNPSAQFAELMRVIRKNVAARQGITTSSGLVENSKRVWELAEQAARQAARTRANQRGGTDVVA